MVPRQGFVVALLFLTVSLVAAEPPEPDSYLEQRMFVVTARATREQLPERVVNTRHLPKVASQLTLGTCGAFSPTYYYRTFLKARDEGWVRPDPATHPERCASTAYTYKLLRRDPLGGASILGTVQNMVDFGVCSLADMPYTHDLDTFTWPDEDFWKAAMPWRPLAAGQIPSIHTLAGQAVLKSHLYGDGRGDMAVIALRNAPNVVDYPDGLYTDNDVLYALQEGSQSIQHAFAVLGYDDTREYIDERDGVIRRGAFLVVNSWGQSWGVGLPDDENVDETGGFAWIAYDLLLRDLQDSRNGSTAAAVMLERGAYAPRVMARIGLNGDTGMISGGLAPSGEGSEWVRLFPGIGDEARPTDQGIWIDASDMLAGGSAGVRLHAWNFHGGAAFIDDFRLASGDETVELPWTASAPVELSRAHDSPTRLYLGRYQQRIPTPEAAILTGDAAWFDWTGNGYLDAAITSPAGTWLWTHSGDPDTGLTTTELPELPAGHTLRWLDANGNGKIDLLIASNAETRIFAGDGTGRFTTVLATLPGCRPRAVAVADFNRDGRPDIVLGKVTETAIYLNNGANGFEKIRQLLPALAALGGRSHGTLAAADVTGNGLPDLLLAGIGQPAYNEPAETRLYRNAGLPLHFEQITTNLPLVTSPAVAFADVDGNGHLDLAISGCTAEKWTRLYINDGNGHFHERNTTLPPLREGTLLWCDLNASGRPDLVGTGATTDDWASPGPRTIAAINRHDATFTDFGLPLPNLYRGFLTAQDVNGNANPDLLLAGTTTWYGEDDPANLVCALYAHGDDAPGIFPFNTPPTAPGNLACTHSGGGLFTFTWDAGDDAETPTAGLRYEWRCGRTPGTGDIVHGEPARSGVQLRNPPVGTLYWQVRTVDSAGATSPWSPVHQFDVPGYIADCHLRLTPSTAWGGSVTAGAPGPFSAGTVVTLIATAAPGFEFAGWEGDLDGLANTSTVTLTIREDRWIEAVFVPRATPVHPVWTLAAETIMEPHNDWFYHTRGHTLESFAGQLIRMGGRRSDNMILDMALTSSNNGASWQYNPNVALPTARYDHVAAVFDGKLWVAGGIGSGGAWLTDVWYTSNLTQWTQATAAAPWTARQGASLVVAGGKLWFLGGGRWGERYCDVWYSSDGANWTAVPTPAAWVQSHNFQADDERPWAVAGNPVRATVLNNLIYATDGQTVWNSPDGAGWTLLAMEPHPIIPLPDGVAPNPFAPLQHFSFTTYDGKLTLLGGHNWRHGELKNEVWESPDGQEWTRTAPFTAPHWSARRTPAVCVHNGKLFLTGGESAGGAAVGDVWHCVPGEMPAGMGGLVIEATPLTPWVAGTTEPPPGTYVDTLETVFEIRAVPAHGYVLDRWEGPVADNGDGDPDTVRVTLDGEETRVRAVFALSHTRLTVRTSPHGAGKTVPPAQTSYAYPPNQWLDLSATAGPGYVFSHWTGPVEDPNSAVTRVFTDAWHEVVAVFRAMPVPDRMSCATDWAAVIRDGSVWAVGGNHRSQMGHDMPMASPGEFWPVALFEGASHVYAVGDGAKAIRGDGAMVTWGSGFLHYQLGVRPRPAYLSLDNVAQTTGGGNLTGLYRKTDGTVVDYLNRPVNASFGAGSINDAIDIASNGTAHFAVLSDGTLLAWGGNRAGQLGIPDIVSSDGPREVPGIDRVYATTLGLDSFRPFTLALRNDGTVWSWGDPRGGQLGRTPSDAEPAGSPAPVPGLTNVAKVAAGSTHALAMTHDGRLYAWGTNHFGQLGTGGYENTETPVHVATPEPVIDVAAGPFYSLLHLADDSYHWMGATPGNPSVPLTVPTVIPGLGAMWAHATLNVIVEPGDADGSTYPPPGEHPVVLGQPIHVRARDGERHVFAHWSTHDAEPDTFLSLAEDTAVTARFRFAHGTLARLNIQTGGQGTTAPPPGEHEVAPGAVLTVTALPAAGHAFSHWEGDVAETAANRTTVLMDRDQMLRAHFVPIPQTVPPRVATGLLHSHQDALVLHADGTAHRFLAGGGTSFVRLNADNDPLGDILRLAVSNSGLCLALAVDGTVWSWGGEPLLGGQNRWDGLTTFPGKVLDAGGPLGNVLEVDAGDDFAMARLADGTLRTWGYNQFGQLGHSLTEHAVPLARAVMEGPVRHLTGIRAAACGGHFAVAVRGDGSVLAWGDNSQGQLGGHGMASSGVPLAVPGLERIVAVAAGADFAAALDSAGGVWTWGSNTVGQCGRVSRSAIAPPGLVGGLPPIAEVAAGRSHMLARDRAGGVWAWGSGDGGRLGNGDTTNRTAPTRVLSPDGTGVLSGIVAINCAMHSYAIDSGGNLYAWGFQRHGVPVTAPMAQVHLGGASPGTDILRTLTLTSFPPEGGILSPAAGTIRLSQGTFVTVSAVPKPGYRFLHWKGSVATTSERMLGLHLLDDTRLTAHFVPDEPRLRLGSARGYAGGSAFINVYFEGNAPPLDGISARMALANELAFTGGSRGTRLGDTCLVRSAFADARTATLLVSGTEYEPVIMPDESLPIYVFEVAIPDDCPPGEYPVTLLPTPAAAIAAGRAWIEPAGIEGVVSVLPEAGIDLLVAMQAAPGPDNERDEPPSVALTSVRQGNEYVAELWLRDQRRDASPIVDIRLDVAHSAVAQVVGFEPNGMIANPTGIVEPGGVSGFGGALPDAPVTGTWHRLGALRFTATAVGANTVTVDPDQVVVSLADDSVLPAEVIELWLGLAGIDQQANQPPVALAAATPLTAAWGTRVAGELHGHDPNPDDQLLFALADGPEHGSVELNHATGEFVYTPLPYHAGGDSFTFTVSDGDGVSEPVVQELYITTGWCMVLQRDSQWAMLGREAGASDRPDDPGDLPAEADAALAFVPPQGHRAVRLQRDIRGSSSNVAWRLEAPARPENTLLSWNPDQAPAGLRILRLTPADCPLGGERSIEMIRQDVLPLAADVDYLFEIAMPTDLVLDLEPGWNLLCLPGAPVFSDRTLGQYSVPGIGPIWSWDRQSYVPVEHVEPYAGYWFHALREGLHFFTILPAFACALPLDSGWNVIGVPRTVQVNALLEPDATVWRYRRQRYEPVESLIPGIGYWLHRDEPDILDLTEDNQ